MVACPLERGRGVGLSKASVLFPRDGSLILVGLSHTESLANREARVGALLPLLPAREVSLHLVAVAPLRN